MIPTSFSGLGAAADVRVWVMAHRVTGGAAVITLNPKP